MLLHTSGMSVFLLVGFVLHTNKSGMPIMIVFISVHSWGLIPEHIPWVPPVHLPGCTCVPDDSQSHWLRLLRDPEVEEPGKPPAEQTLYHGTCSFTGPEEPHSIHGYLWHHRPLCPAPKNSSLHGSVCGWPGQLFWRSSSVLSGSVHGGPVGKINQIHSRHTDITYYSKTVSEKTLLLHLILILYKRWFSVIRWPLCHL